MLRNIWQRLWQGVWVVAAVSLFCFVLIYLSGDPIAALVPLNARQEDIDAIRRAYHLDEPLLTQYGLFVSGALRGDMGDSFRYRTAALPLVLSRIPNTLILAIASLSFSALIAIPLGVLAAVKQGRWPAKLLSIGTLFAISLPAFWLGVMLILVFAGALRWFPASGMGSWRHIVLPMITASLFSIGFLIRLVKRSVSQQLKQDYAMAARGRGFSEARVVWRHVLRNSAIPLVTALGLQLGVAIGGSVIVETVFAWPGVGWLMIQAVEARDLPVVRAGVMILSVFIVLINLAVDLIYTWLDPRIRLGGRPS